MIAGTDRLDKAMTIGQMQGKFQLVMVAESGEAMDGNHWCDRAAEQSGKHTASRSPQGTAFKRTSRARWWRPSSPSSCGSRSGSRCRPSSGTEPGAPLWVRLREQETLELAGQGLDFGRVARARAEEAHEHVRATLAPARTGDG